MKVFNIALPTSPTALSELIGDHSMDGIQMQAPSGNAAIAYFGAKSQQPFELSPGGSAELLIQDTEDLYILGTSPDRLSILLFP